jgi:hypothetical protein
LDRLDRYFAAPTGEANQAIGGTSKAQALYAFGMKSQGVASSVRQRSAADDLARGRETADPLTPIGAPAICRAAAKAGSRRSTM